MAYNPGPGEPYLGPFGAFALSEIVSNAPRVVLVDGRGGAGKTTLATAIASLIDDSTVVHTDDVAWHHSLFDWDSILYENIIEPYLKGDAVSYRPPGWIAKDRPGSIDVPAGTRCLIVEGSGSVRDSLVPFAELTMWVQGDIAEQRRRGIARDVESGVNGTLEEATKFWDEWQEEEIRFFQNTRPWDTADWIVESTEQRADGPWVQAVRR